MATSIRKQVRDRGFLYHLPTYGYPNESAAQCAVDALRLTINRQTPHKLLKAVSVETLVKHYREHELPDIFHNRKPTPGIADEGQKTYSTQYVYEVYLNNWILPRWRSYRISDVKAVDMEAWLKTVPLARGSKAKIRNIMSALFSHAIRWEWADKNPITDVRQSAKRLRTPDVLTSLKITALLAKLPEPLRTAAELDAFTGLRRGELIGLQCHDVSRWNATNLRNFAPRTAAAERHAWLGPNHSQKTMNRLLPGGKTAQWAGYEKHMFD